MGTSARTSTSPPMCMENRYVNRTLRRLWDEGCERGIYVSVMAWARRQEALVTAPSSAFRSAMSDRFFRSPSRIFEDR